MGGSSPHCGACEEGAARSAFSRGYASKRLPLNASINRPESTPYNARNHASKAGTKGEYFYSKGSALAFKILVAAFALWTLFQIVVLLDANLARHSSDLVGDGLKRFPKLSNSLLNATMLTKHKPSSVHFHLQRQNWGSFRRPRLALVCGNVGNGPDSLFLVTLAKEFRLLDYQLEVYALSGGSLHSVYSDQMAIPVTLISDLRQASLIDWSRYEGVLAFSYVSRHALASLLQDPFKQIPLIWSLESCGSLDVDPRNSQHLIKRAKAVVFPHHIPDGCGYFDIGNFFAVPGSPLEVWEAEKQMLHNERHAIRSKLGIHPHDFVVVVGSTSSTNVWKAHAMAMQAVAKLEDGEKTKLFVLSNGNTHQSYDVAVKAMAAQFGLLNNSVNFMEEDRSNEVLWAADVFVYVAMEEERFFPPLLIRAMAFGRVVLAPTSQGLQQYIVNGVNGFLYTREDYETLCNHLVAVRKTSDSSTEIGSAARSAARNLFAREAVAGYAELLEATLEFPSEVSLPTPSASVRQVAWEWDLVDGTSVRSDLAESTGSGLSILSTPADGAEVNREDEEIREEDIAEEKFMQVLEEIDRVEEEEAEGRRELVQGSYEDVSRGVKKAEREKFEFHERDDGELERTGQPLCIYEVYQGPGAWPFLHQNDPLYRGLSLSSRGRRPRADDVDATSRLPLLNDTYYRNSLCDFGAFLAIANRIDRIHKNSWIGFQTWSSAGRKLALSQAAETSLVEDIRAGRHGDAVYFWVPADDDANTSDFWSLCDARNAGSCRRVFLETFQRMYGVSTELPFMPAGAWSSMHSWAMPTSSFVEFVLFSRMFLDSMDSLFYGEHHGHGKCPLASTKLEAQQCYCRILETLVNVWAYHSARRLVHIDPRTGKVTEEHGLDTRRGQMKIKWFSLTVLKAMDEDLAQKADDEHPNHRWLWPHTGEVFWQGILERERQERYNLKVEKKRRNKERLARMRSRYKQKSLGRYVKPAPGTGYVPVEPDTALDAA